MAWFCEGIVDTIESYMIYTHAPHNTLQADECQRQIEKVNRNTPNDNINTWCPMHLTQKWNRQKKKQHILF